MKPVKKAVIIAAGLGTRFLPATKAMPKEMLPVLDKPVIQYIVEEMAASGIKQVIFVTSPTKHAIKDHFSRNIKLENMLKEKGKLNRLKSLVDLRRKVKFSYATQARPLGNGHALLCAKKMIGKEPFAFSDGDGIIDAKVPVVGQLLKAFNRYGASVMGVGKLKDKQEMTKYGNIYADTKYPSASPFGLSSGRKLRAGSKYESTKKIDARNAKTAKLRKVEEGRIYRVEKFVEKPPIDKVSPHGLISGGMRYVFTPDIWPILEKTEKGKGGEIWLADAANTLAQEKPFYAYHYEGKYLDTGNEIALLKATLHFALKDKKLSEEIKEIF